MTEARMTEATGTFGRLMRNRRRALDLTQKELAKQVGYSIVTIRKIEADERRPSRQLAERLAYCLELTPEERRTFVTLARTGGGDAVPRLIDQLDDVATRRAQADRPPSNLTTPLTRLIGREEDVAQVRAWLLQRDTRLVTLVGPPGIGKSSLGLQVATELLGAFPDGVFTVAIGPLRDPALVASTVAKVLGLKETAASSLVSSIVDYLRDRRALLLFDNFEHLLAAAPFVTEVLTACPGVKGLATSRAPLHVRGEALYPVPPLALPDLTAATTAASISGYAAVQLFVERATAVKPDFALADADAADVAALCAGLDGLPLAIELVAAKVSFWPPHTLLARLNHRLALLTDGPRDLPVHQQTLRGTIDWSYDLLDAGQQALFARLAVFVGGCALRTAERVAGADLPIAVLDGLTALADQNLLRQEDRADGERYFVFFETIREYALERLIARGEEPAVRAAYAASYSDLVELAHTQLAGEEQEAWLDRLDAEHDNIRSALEWFAASGNPAMAARMAAGLWKFWHIRGHQTEGRRWVSVALGLPGVVSPDILAQARYGAGWISLDLGDTAGARRHFDESLALFRSLSDPRGIAEALHGVGMMMQADGDDALAATLYEESLDLYRELDDDEGIAWSLDHLGSTALSLDDYERAGTLLGESLTIFRRLGHTWGTAISLHHQGLAIMARGDIAAAARLVREDLVLFKELDNGWGVAACYAQLGYVALAEHDHRGAERHFRTSLTLSQAEKDQDTVAGLLVGLASTAVAAQRFDAAAGLLGAYDALTGANKIRMNPYARRLHSEDLGVLRARLDRETFDRAWATGRSMTLRQAIAFALTAVADG